MANLWDYDQTELNKTENGQLFILERMINYGPAVEKGEKISLSAVKNNWNKLNLYPEKKRLFEYLIWGTISPLPKSSGTLSIK